NLVAASISIEWFFTGTKEPTVTNLVIRRIVPVSGMLDSGMGDNISMSTPSASLQALCKVPGKCFARRCLTGSEGNVIKFAALSVDRTCQATIDCVRLP